MPGDRTARSVGTLLGSRLSRDRWTRVAGLASIWRRAPWVEEVPDSCVLGLAGNQTPVDFELTADELAA